MAGEGSGCRGGCAMFWSALYLLSGLCLICMGTWLMMDYRVYDVTIMYNYNYIDDKMIWYGATWGSIALGCYCTVIGTIGMVGIGCLSRAALVAFLVLGTMGFLGSAFLGSFTTYYWFDNPVETVETTMLANLKEYYVVESTDDFSMAWDRSQVMHACCGVDYYYDYANSNFINKTGGYPDVPWTCCTMEQQHPFNIDESFIVNQINCYKEADEANTGYIALNPMGCGETIVKQYKDFQISLMGVFWGSAALQLLSIIIAGCAAKPFTKYRTTRTDDYRY